MFAALIEVSAIVLVYMLLHLDGVQLQERWLISLYSLTSLTSLFAGFTLLFFRYRTVVYIFILIQLLFLTLYCMVAIRLIEEDDSYVKYSDFEAEKACNRLVAQLGVLMCVRLLIFVGQLVIIMFRLKLSKRENGEGESGGDEAQSGSDPE